jgi:hypothetical protein
MYLYTYNILLIIHEERRLLHKLRLIRINNIKKRVEDVWCKTVWWIHIFSASTNDRKIWANEFAQYEVYSLIKHRTNNLKMVLIIMIIITVRKQEQQYELLKWRLYHWAVSLIVTRKIVIREVHSSSFSI